MKNALVVAPLMAFAVLGCWSLHGRTQRPTEPPRTVSDGGFTWYVGGVVVDGSKLPVGQVKFRALPAANAASQTGGESQ